MQALPGLSAALRLPPAPPRLLFPPTNLLSARINIWPTRDLRSSSMDGVRTSHRLLPSLMFSPVPTHCVLSSLLSFSFPICCLTHHLCLHITSCLHCISPPVSYPSLLSCPHPLSPSVPSLLPNVSLLLLCFYPELPPLPPTPHSTHSLPPPITPSPIAHCLTPAIWKSH